MVLRNIGPVVNVAVSLALFAIVFVIFYRLSGGWPALEAQDGTNYLVARTPLLAMLAGWLAAASWVWWRASYHHWLALLPFAFAVVWLGYLLFLGGSSLYISQTLEGAAHPDVSASPAQLWHEYQNSQLARSQYMEDCRAAVIRDYLATGKRGVCPDPEHPGRNLVLDPALQAAKDNSRRYGVIVTHYSVVGWIALNSLLLGLVVILLYAGLAWWHRRRQRAG